MKILRRLDASELYTGKIAASEQNERYIYEISAEGGKLRYRAIYTVDSLTGSIGKYDGSWFSDEEGNFWCETEESRKLDPASIREDRLRDLGI